MADAASNAVHISSKGVDISATDQAVQIFGKIWEYTLWWASQYPYEFYATLAFLAFWIYQRRIGRTQIARLKAQYQQRRDANKIPELPLPSGNR